MFISFRCIITVNDDNREALFFYEQALVIIIQIKRRIEVEKSKRTRLSRRVPSELFS